MGEVDVTFSQAALGLLDILDPPHEQKKNRARPIVAILGWVFA